MPQLWQVIGVRRLVDGPGIDAGRQWPKPEKLGGMSPYRFIILVDPTRNFQYVFIQRRLTI